MVGGNCAGRAAHGPTCGIETFFNQTVFIFKLLPVLVEWHTFHRLALGANTGNDQITRHVEKFANAMDRVHRFIESVLEANGYDDRADRREKAFVILAITFGTTELIAFGMPKKRAAAAINACKTLLDTTRNVTQ